MLYKAVAMNGHLYIGEGKLVSESPTHLNVEWSTWDGPADDTEFTYATHLTKGVHALYTTPAASVEGFINEQKARIKNANERITQSQEIIGEATRLLVEAGEVDVS